MLVHARLDSDGLLEGALAGVATLEDEEGEEDQAEERVAAVEVVGEWLELRRLPPIMGFVGSGPGLVIILA